MSRQAAHFLQQRGGLDKDVAAAGLRQHVFHHERHWTAAGIPVAHKQNLHARIIPFYIRAYLATNSAVRMYMIQWMRLKRPDKAFIAVYAITPSIRPSEME